MKITKTVPPLPPRPSDAHKNRFGHLAVIAGSTGLTGAACLTCMAALRTGAGLVTLGAPVSLNPILEIKLTEVMTRPLPQTESGTLAAAAFPTIMEMIAGANLLAIGPGLSTERSTVELVAKIVSHCDKPMVVDADALNAIARTGAHPKGPAVFTPHPGEFARLTGLPVQTIQSDRESIAADYARKHQVVLVLKGAQTVVTDGKNLYRNPTGNSGMATAGVGDLLTGIIAGALAQGMPPLEAAMTGVYLHGVAGDLAAKTVGGYALIASDLLTALPQAIGELQTD